MLRLNSLQKCTLSQRLMFALGAIFLAVTFASASAEAATVANSNGGDGFVTANSPGCLMTHDCNFTVTGTNNSSSNNYTTYSDVASADGTYNFVWSYSTSDSDGAYWDQAGYVLNGVFTYLVSSGYVANGKLAIFLNVGDTFGFFIHSLDGILGRGQIEVLATPIPASIVLLGSGLLGLLAIGRRRKRIIVS